ncbi:MAG: oligosaccharide flippase family protein [Synechococcales cyanobacterium]
MKAKVLENMLALMIVQGSQYVLPLVTYPFLLRTVGTEGFGILGLAHTLGFYFVVLTDYGFSLTATRAIAIHRHEPDRLSELISGIWLMKGGLILLGFLLTLAFCALVPGYWDYRWVFVGSYLRVVGDALFPLWYFQGLERMKVITALNLLAKSWTVLAILLWVKHPDDLVLAAVLNSSGSLLMGILGLGMILRDPLWRWQRVSLSFVCQHIRQGFPVFLAQLSHSLLTNTHVIILGLFADLSTLGSFILAERIVRALSLIVVPLGNAIYPQISQIFQASRATGLRFLRQWIPPMVVGFILLSLAMFTWADTLVFWLGGSPNPDSSRYVQWMASMPLITLIYVMFGNGILMALGYNHRYSRCFVMAGSLVFILSLLTVPWLGANATAVLMPLGDGILTGFILWTVWDIGITPLLRDRYTQPVPKSSV